MLAVVGVIALAVLACTVTLWPRGELPKPPGGGQADSTRLVSATLTKVARVDCPEADPGVPGSVCVKVTAQLARGRQVSFDTTDPTEGGLQPAEGRELVIVDLRHATIMPPPWPEHRAAALAGASRDSICI